MWVLGYQGISSNKAADRLARAGSANAFSGQELFCELSHSYISVLVGLWVRDEIARHCIRVSGLCQAK